MLKDQRSRSRKPKRGGSSAWTEVKRFGHWAPQVVADSPELVAYLETRIKHGLKERRS